ncbi:MAG: molybdopterin-dependent oxidoreductase [Desulfobacterales bacterium]|jgi:anaerobic selenocysteine-containing dehydrogenase
MKIDRRSFLSFVIGGAAGTALSPLPWKLIDDSSIWSQNWAWTPIPERGEITHVNSTCTLCPGGCGITVSKVGDRVIKIEGMMGHPVNDGGICALGASGMQLLYGPTRVKTPQKKINGRWRTISWEAAMAEVIENLQDLRTNGLSHSLACICDSDRGTVPGLLKRFLTAYGSPNFIRTPSSQDNYEQALYLTQGVRALAGFDVPNSDVILSFGSGLIEGWQSPVYMIKSKSALKQNGGRMAQIEPRLSKTAAKSDRWIAVKPGTEGVMALGIANVIINEGLYHTDFVENYSAGFVEWKKLVIDRFSPSAVSKITGSEVATIASLAREFAKARRPLAICGRGTGTSPGSLQDFLAVHMLNAMVGNINQPGGMIAVAEPDYINWPEAEMDEIASRGLQQPRLDAVGDADNSAARYLLNRLPEAVNAAAESPIRMLFVSGTNPVYEMSDTQAVVKAFEKIPLVVSFSSYMDETAAQADLILPNHIYLERYEDVPFARGFPKQILGLTQPVVDPLYNTQHTGEVIIQLAKEMGGTLAKAFSWDSYQGCLEDTLEDLPALQEKGFRVDDEVTGSNWAEAFGTDSAQFEFSSNRIDALPDYTLPVAQGDESFYQLLLVPYDSMRLASSYVGSPPFLVKALEDSILKGNDVLVEINPATAKKLGLSNGQDATLSTPIGSGRVKIYFFDGIMPGVVAIPRGLGHTGENKFLAGKGLNYNALCAPVEDPASGLDAAWGIRAKLAKV